MKTNHFFSLLLPLIICFATLSNWSYTQNQKRNAPGVRKITENIHLVSDYGCNVIIVEGQGELLMVDSGHKRYSTALDSVISSLSDFPIKYILNTHFHLDHVRGNKKLSDRGAIIVAHENARTRMLSEWNVPDVRGREVRVIPPYPREYLADICFKDSIDLFYGDGVIKAIHYPNAHTNTDVAYFIQKENVILTGDLFFANGFPIIDIFYGGTINGYMSALDNLLKICDSNTVVIPGHGLPTNRQGLQDYQNMLTESISRILRLKEEGKTIDEIVDSHPIGYLYKGEESWVPEDVFIYTVYNGLSEK
ncbi:MAG: MBL fold metallo-hydrolase [Bacteroidales bacterium]|nr:MBL fold metallo-hydrolase [Bacteroidales bacterium]